MILDGEREDRAVDAAFDYVIVGSGAAGAAAARILADTGSSLAVVEEGPAVETREFSDLAWPSFKRLFRGMGAQAARGRALIPVVQGRCLGGSTVVNSGIIWRLPRGVWESWRTEHGLGEALPWEALNRHWDLLERELSVRPVERAVWGEHNRLFDVAGRALGVRVQPTRRNESGCRGSARCLTGCPFGAKQSMLVSYLPYSSERGAAIFASARADRVVLEGGRAQAVEGRFRRSAPEADLAPFRLRARKGVIVAASAVQTPGLLRRSGVRSPHLGRHFQGHPGCPLIGLFDARVNMWSGATQGFESDEHQEDLGYKIETLSLPPELVFARMPGVGRQWVDALAETPRAALWAVQLRSSSEGSVREGPFGTDIRFDLSPGDMARLKKALRFTAELFFTAGAREVLPGVHGLPERLQSPRDAALLESGPDDPGAYSFILSHLFGTARMSVRPQDGVVGADFAVHGAKGLYVVDSSLFPTNLGVNPQHPIMGVAMHAARRIAGEG